MTPKPPLAAALLPALLAGAVLAVGGPAGAGAPAISPLPRPAPGGLPPPAATAVSGLAVAVSPWPQARPALAIVAPIPTAAPPGDAPSALQPVSFRAPMGPGTTAGGKGTLCGDPLLRGETIPPVVGRVRGCGIAAPVRLTAVAGIALSEPAELSCPTARALGRWVTRGLIPAVGGAGGGVKQLVVFGSYVCRPVDGLKGERLSLHSEGEAIDIGGYVLRSGAQVSVARDWRRPGEGAVLQAAYHAACGIFGTTLGPNGDRFHQTHMHFDIAHYAGGAYCH